MRKSALLIGITEYGDGIPSLSAPARDVQALTKVLRDPTIGGFEPEAITKLINADMTQLRLAIFQFFKNADKGDLLLLYFSGYGITDDSDKLYLAAHKTGKDSYMFNALPATYVQERSDQSDARQQVIILDCCYRSAFKEGWRAKSADLNLQKLWQQLGAEGRAVLTACTATQKSFQQEDGKLSLYTQYLVEGIETGAADHDQDGKIHVQELHKYAKTKVQEVKPKQKPEIVSDPEGFNILLCRAPIHDLQLKFRQIADSYVRRNLVYVRNTGDLSPVDQRNLKLQSQKLGLDLETANQIIDSILDIYRRQLAYQQEYRNAFREALAEAYPLSKELRQELDELKKELGLAKKDVASIERRLEAPYLNQWRLKRREVVEAERRRLQQKQPLASEGRGPLPITQPAQPAQSTQSAQPAQLIQPVQGLSPINSTIPSPQTIDLGRGVGLTLVKIPGGQFWMGSAPEDIQGANYEYPQHQVQVPAFWLGETPVTQAQWLAVMGQFKRDPGFKGADRPIENISWQDAMEFCQHLSQRMGQILRLPTEAEWEYACRAGSQTRYCFGDDTTLLGDYAWYNANSGSKTHGVKQKKPNLWGLYDMHGNVWEWCADQWHKTYQQKPETSLQNGSIPWSCPRQSPNHNTVNHNTVTIQVLRGGAWYNAPRSCRSVIRGRGKCKSFYNLRGFRLALSFGALSIGAL